MARIKNMGHATAKFNEGIILTGSDGNLNPLICSNLLTVKYLVVIFRMIF